MYNSDNSFDILDFSKNQNVAFIDFFIVAFSFVHFILNFVCLILA